MKNIDSIHPFDNYVIPPGSLALMDPHLMTLRHLLMEARLARPETYTEPLPEISDMVALTF
jgi:hypothetical protein